MGKRERINRDIKWERKKERKKKERRKEQTERHNKKKVYLVAEKESDIDMSRERYWGQRRQQW